VEIYRAEGKYLSTIFSKWAKDHREWKYLNFFLQDYKHTGRHFSSKSRASYQLVEKLNPSATRFFVSANSSITRQQPHPYFFFQLGNFASEAVSYQTGFR